MPNSEDIDDSNKLLRVNIDHELLSTFPESEQYILLLIGHIHNEISTLIKLLRVATPKSKTEDEKARDVKGGGALFLITFFAKILFGKCYEAHAKINSKEFNEFINKYCLINQNIGGVPAAKKRFNKAFSECKWLAPVRNEHVMHYADIGDWRAALKLMNENKMKYEAIMSTNSYSRLFRSSDTASFLAFVMEANESDWHGGTEKITEEGIELGTILSNFLGDCFGEFVETLRGDEELKKFVQFAEIEDFPRPIIEQTELPFFFDRATY